MSWRNNARQRLHSLVRNVDDVELAVNGAELTWTQIMSFKRITGLPALSLAYRPCALWRGPGRRL